MNRNMLMDAMDEWHRKPVSALSAFVGILAAFATAAGAVMINKNDNYHQNQTDVRLEQRIEKNEQVITRVDRKLASIETGVDVIRGNQQAFQDDIKEIRKALEDARILAERRDR